MRVGVPCQQNDSGCVPVQTVDDAGVRKDRLSSRDETVGFFRSYAGYREQARRFVEDHDVVILEQDGWNRLHMRPAGYRMTSHHG